MAKNIFHTSMIIILLISGTSLAQSKPNESSSPTRRFNTWTPFIDYGVHIPAPGLSSYAADPNSSVNSEEALYATYSFSNEGTIYNVEFYYRALYNRVRVRVLVEDRELHGLYNRFYHIDPVRSDSVFVTRRQEGIHMNCLNSGGLFLTESSLDTDVMYDAIETYIHKNIPENLNPRIVLYPPPGLLKKTCVAGSSELYLIDENGLVAPLTIENLQKAYFREKIVAQSSEDYERIGLSMIKTENWSFHGDIKVISDTNEIYKNWPEILESENYDDIKPPWLYRDNSTKTDYWNCYIHKRQAMLIKITPVRYRFGFQNGQIISAEKIISDRELRFGSN